jgi:hypothetical protein
VYSQFLAARVSPALARGAKAAALLTTPGQPGFGSRL